MNFRMERLKMIRRSGKFTKGIIFDLFLVVFWVAVLLFELFFTGDLLLAIVALACIFVFSALLGRDIRKQRTKMSF